MARFLLVERAPARFNGDFGLEPIGPYVPTADESSYLDALTSVVDSLARDEAADSSAGAAGGATDPTPKILERQRSRTAIAAELKAEATAFVADALTPATASRNALVIKGKYRRDCERLDKLLFVVDVKLDTTEKYAAELLVEVSPDRAGVNPSAEQNELYAALQSAENVIKAVCQRMRDGKAGQREDSRANLLQDLFIRKLAGIGRVGLQGPDVPLAKLALEGVRSEFVMQEAGRVKNTYLKRLGVMAGAAALFFLLVYSVVDWDLTPGNFWVRHKTFLLAAAGASIGTWLSFSIRRVSLNFEDLGVLEEDLLDPALRVIFVVAMTITACLLFWNGAINLKIGALETTGLIGSKALLIGIFCGIAERALATAISGRAASFVNSIGGTS